MTDIRNIIENAESVAFFTTDNPKESELLAKKALAEVFHLKGISVYFFPETPTAFKTKWSPIVPEREKHNIVYNTSISIPKSGTDIQEVNYESDGDHFTFHIGTYNKHIKQEDLILEQRPMKIDAAFCFGECDEISDKFLSLVEKENIIPVISDNKPVAEIVFNLVQTIKDQPFVKTAIPSLLLASLFLETDSLENKSNPDLLILAGSLLKFGAEEEKIKEILEQGRPDAFPQLLGRALARTQTSSVLKSIWTFVSQHDLEKTKAQDADPSLFYQLATSVRKLMPYQPITIVLWQKEGSVRALITHNGGERNTFQNITRTLHGETKNGYFITDSFNSFSEAEIKIQEALRENI